MTRDDPHEPFIEAERRKMLEAKTIKDAKRIRDEHRAKCIEVMLQGFFDMQRSLGYEPRQDHPDPRICLTAAFDSLDPVAVVRSRNGLERYHDELTNPPERKL